MEVWQTAQGGWRVSVTTFSSIPNMMRRDDNAPQISAATTNRPRYTKRCAVVVVEGATLALL